MTKQLLLNKITATIVSVCLLSFSSTGYSQEVDNRLNINAGVVDYLFNGDKNQDDDIGFQLGLEFPLSERLSGTIQHSEVESDVLNSIAEADLSLLHGGINYNFDQIRGGWQPYVGVGIGKLRLAGVGAAHFDRESLDVNAA